MSLMTLLLILHIYTNSFETNLDSLIEKRYQKTLVLNVKLDLDSKIGAAIMDGNFVFSYLMDLMIIICFMM